MLNYRRFGSGKTVVLQHGFVGGGEYFAPLSANLAQNYDVIATDLPGFAGSAHIPVPDTIAEIATALVDTVTGLGVERFSLLGHSLGSVTALQAALDYPERIENLILYGSTPSGALPDRFETWEDTISRISSRNRSRPWPRGSPRPGLSTVRSTRSMNLPRRPARARARTARSG